jgi:hypothetical protein
MLALVCVFLVAAQGPADDSGDMAREPQGGAGVQPIEIVPRIELRQSAVRQRGGALVNDTTIETDVQFARRLVFRYQIPYRVLSAQGAQVRGLGDVQVQTLGILTADARRMAALLVGVVLSSASDPRLGEGKQQLVLGAGGALKPRPFWIAYGIAQQTLSVGGSSDRASIDELDLIAGSVLFGWQFNWLKVDLDGRFDFVRGVQRLFGSFELGSLLIGRVGMFLRSGTQLGGPRQLDYSLSAGIRYLFRLEASRPRGP